MYMLEAVSCMVLSQLYTREWEIRTLGTLGAKYNEGVNLVFFLWILVGFGPSNFPCVVYTSLVVRISPTLCIRHDQERIINMHFSLVLNVIIQSLTSKNCPLMMLLLSNVVSPSPG
jgi:hypothetical protein